MKNIIDNIEKQINEETFTITILDGNCFIDNLKCYILLIRKNDLYIYFKEIFRESLKEVVEYIDLLSEQDIRRIVKKYNEEEGVDLEFLN